MSARHAAGAFDVTVTPLPAEVGVGDESIGRMALSKRFHGDLQASALGQMLATRTPTPGSAAYVALDPDTKVILSPLRLKRDGKNSVDLAATQGFRLIPDERYAPGAG